jgi:hypothetical protein
MTLVVICYVNYAMKSAKREAEMDRTWAKLESERLKIHGAKTTNRK